MNNFEHLFRILIILFFIYSYRKPKETHNAMKKSLKSTTVIGATTFFVVFVLKKYQILIPDKHYEVISPLILLFILTSIFHIVKNNTKKPV